MDLAALKTELTTDPLGRGYAAMSDVEASESLNTRNRQPNRESLTGGEIASAVDAGELIALGTSQENYVMSLFGCDSIPVTQNFKQNLAGLFGAATETRANLLAIFQRTGSRAEELGLGNVTPSHVADARRLP